MPELPVKNVFFGNAKVNCQRIGRLQDVTGFAMKDVDIHSEDSLLTLDGCSVVVNPLSPIHYSQKLERPHIIKNPRNGKYVLWAKSQATDGYFAIFQADNFMGPYTFIRNLQPEGYGVGDFDMYVDEQTGKGYSRRTVEAFAKRYANHQPLPQKPKGTEPQVIDRRYKLVDMGHAVYHAGYVFLPITFENGIPRIHWLEEWRL